MFPCGRGGGEKTLWDSRGEVGVFATTKGHDELGLRRSSLDLLALRAMGHFAYRYLAGTNRILETMISAQFLNSLLP